MVRARKQNTYMAGLVAVILGFAALAASCAEEGGGNNDCKISDDCELGEVCLNRKCEAPGGGNANNPNNNPNNANNPNNNPNNGGGSCEGGADPSAANIVINEVLLNVPNDPITGDVNGDGTRDASQDEFIELVNISAAPVKIGGLMIAKEDSVKTSIKLSCLQPGEVLVVFGGGASAPAIAGAKVEVSDSTFGLNNSGTTVNLLTASGPVSSVVLPGSGPVSLVRATELDPAAEFVEHTMLAADKIYSPGTCADGSAISGGCGGVVNPNNNNNNNNMVGMCDDAPGPGPSADRERIMVNEVLLNVPNDPVTGDVNGDGTRDAAQDEFIEIVNISGETVRIKGLQISKEDSLKTEVKLECLPPGGVLVIFGGGETAPTIPGALVEISDSTFGLNNSGTTVNLNLPNGDLVQSIVLPGSGPVSLVRATELLESAEFVEHTTLAADALYSPGTCANGDPISSGCTGNGNNNPMPECMTNDDCAGNAEGRTECGPAGTCVTPGAMCNDADPPTCADATTVSSCVGGAITTTACTGVDVCTAGVCAPDPNNNPGPCDDADATGANDLVLNEILTDPAADLPGDANGDGVRDSADDEFIELWNVSGGKILIEGITIRKEDAVKHTLSGCLEPNTGIVIFGGLEDTGTLPSYPGTTVLLADSSFGWVNGGTTINIVAPDGATVLTTYTTPAGNDTSFVRQPELSPTGTFTEHNTVGNNSLFSPGACADGTDLTGGCQ